MSDVVAAPGASEAASDLISALRKKAPRTAVALAAAQLAWPILKGARERVAARARYTVRVPGGDGVYDDLHEWILGLLPDSERRALVAYSLERDFEIAADGDASPDRALRMRFDTGREHVISVGAHKVRVSLSDPETGRKRRETPPDVVFAASSAAGRDALCEQIGDVLRRARDASRRPCFRMLSRWEDWERVDVMPPRPLESVVLPPGQMERIAADVQRFLASEADYVRRGVPWHRGHLYEGPPGTGKTSAARALASHFGMDVWYLPLGSVKKDDALLRVVRSIRPRSMLLLEDVDVFHAARSRDSKKGLSLSGLVNALDGIATPHGLLTVMTTNVPDVIDEAVVRPGRVDLVEHFGLAGPAEVARIVARFYGEPVEDGAGLAQVAASRVTEVCKRHDGAQAALAALRAQEGDGL